MFTVFIGIGSNIGNRIQNCLDAIDYITDFTIVEEVSSFYETEPVGNENQPEFINAVAKVSTMHSPLHLLNYLKAVEKKMGRNKTMRWTPRIIDLDILLYEDFKLNSQELVIPHSQLHQRKFVLEPLCELDSSIEHPILNQKISTILDELEDEREVVKIGKFYTENPQ